jgi:23S rRNA pseudouridine1911/1915/1917 synthase
MNIPIVYEDDWLLVADKPSGLLVIPTPKNEQRTLTSILNEDVQKKGMSFRLHPCHRLDRETSGLIIYAKGKSVQKKMMEMFRDKKIKKAYLAFVQGMLPRNEGEIKLSIEGAQAVTKYRAIERQKNFTVAEIWPLTGRTNQIRLHFKAIGHPIVGETRFAFRRDFALKAKRLCLHASRLEFRHPLTGRLLQLESGLADGLKDFLKNHE